jgi:energy-coupling factor transport system permease protein
MDVAATLEVRGFATARRAPSLQRPYTRHDVAFLASALSLIGLALLGRLAGAAAFDAYPEVHARLAPDTLAVCAGVLAATLLPFADRRGIEP